MRYVQQTLSASEVPEVMRIYGVTSGYRLLNQPWIYYFKSLFHLHNQTLNIWTHLLGAILVLYQTYVYYGIYSLHDSEIKWTVLAFGILCSETLLNSTVAHLLCSKSPYVDHMIFLYDYLGIVSSGFATNFLAVYGVSDKDTYHWIGHNYIVVQVILAYFNFINLCLSQIWYAHDKTSIRRKGMIAIGIGTQVVFTTVPWIQRYSICLSSETCQLSSLNHIAVVYLSFIMMSISYLVHFPECIKPGHFDIFGHSHQIFHVLTIITKCLKFRCLYIDFLNGENDHCKPGMLRTVVCIAILNMAGILTIACVKERVRNRFKCHSSKYM